MTGPRARRRRIAASGSLREVSVPPTATAPSRLPYGAIAALFLASIALRPQILAIGPLLPLIRTDLDIAAGIAGLLLTIPVLCMGIFAPFGPRIAARLGRADRVRRLPGPHRRIRDAARGRPGCPAPPALDPRDRRRRRDGRRHPLDGGLAARLDATRAGDRRLRRRHRARIGAGGGDRGPVAGPAHDWRQALLILSIAAFLPIAAWLILIQPDPNSRPLEARAPRLPWRSTTGWLLVLVFGLQSLLYYGVVSWLPNALVERGWAPADAGAMSGLAQWGRSADDARGPARGRPAGRSPRAAARLCVLSLIAMTGIVAVPDLAIAWVVLIGLGLGAIFPLVLTLPIDVADEPAQVGSVAALMLLGGYLISAGGPVLLGVARDLTGDFETSLGSSSPWVSRSRCVVRPCHRPACTADPAGQRTVMVTT